MNQPYVTQGNGYQRNAIDGCNYLARPSSRWSLEEPERSLAGRTRKGAIESGTQE